MFHARKIDNDSSLTRLVRAATVKLSFDGISDMTLWRWIRYRGFPKPRKLNGQNYWKPEQVELWRRNNVS